ncbi:3-oxoacyl-[acyl-carrier-protein] synthase-3 [Seinonella peptonophila]|uniref:3-oxoacyl-[acyl-carrier-protein] synthase-3 n=1 Tax=Seinonella peptonophila TaxID=112248 RepID=A0A1M4WHF2_9BACL|nr:beta-ketoacyl-ACP synthase III [Seinonella peptonophila]SHE80625.1 3-oxoacyl-[acyl-carrier-protein] synthase-3 [Seinonella peptonophila]
MKRKVRILGTGAYLPEREVSALEIDTRLGTKPGWVEKKSGVLTRRFVGTETAAWMGAKAAEMALEHAKVTLDEIDCIVSASGTVEQAIPCTASLIYHHLDPSHMKIPAFDFNATCLSFVAAFDHLSYLISAGRYQNILLVSSEIASIGLNWKQKESSSLFGDGAAAVVIGPSSKQDASHIMSSRMETYPQGVHTTEIRGGGTKHHPRTYKGEVNWEDFLFDMDGEAVFRLTAKFLPDFVKRLFTDTSKTLQEVDLVIPHQASVMAMKLIQRRLKLTEGQMMMIAPQYGNMIAASIPFALHLAIQSGQLQRDQTSLLLGTSAGLSFGGILFVY